MERQSKQHAGERPLWVLKNPPHRPIPPVTSPGIGATTVQQPAAPTMKKILIVEDQPELRLLVRTTLEDEDVEIWECANADEGWREALRLSPDLIVLDIMMPGTMDGLQLCRKLKSTAATQRARVVLVSARGHRNDMLIGKDAGADDYLMKPFSPARLRDVVTQLLSPA